MTALDPRRLELRSIFENLVVALGRKDFDTVEALMTEDVVCEWPYRPIKDMDEVMIGNRKFREFCEQGMATCDPYRHKITQFYDLVEPEAIIAEYYSDTIFHPTGARYSNRYLGLARFRGNRVCYWKEYINPMIVKEVMGL